VELGERTPSDDVLKLIARALGVGIVFDREAIFLRLPARQAEGKGLQVEKYR